MGEATDNVMSIGAARRLSDAIRDVKNAAADRSDVVIELGEATRMRLELLASDLETVFNDVPADIDLFDFTISSGLQPRLWIDAVSHVDMGRDRRTYRFLTDTRIGRVVLAESPSIRPVADQVTRYVAERIVERQRLMEGSPQPAIQERAVAGEATPPARDTHSERWSGFLSGLMLVAAGAFVGLVFAVALMWDRVAAYLQSF